MFDTFSAITVGGKTGIMNKQQILEKIDTAWAELKASYAGLSDAELSEGGVTGEWSVRDILAHVNTWEEEALKHLPLIIDGGTPPRYSVTYGGIDAFNAEMTKQKRDLPLSEVLRRLDETHARLVEYLQGAPDEQFTRETRARRRMKWDTYGHYPIHATAISEWRNTR